MKKNSNILLQIIIVLAICALFIVGLLFLYDHSDFFRSLFNTDSGGVLGASDGSAPTLAERAATAGRLSVYIYSFILAMQICAFYIGIYLMTKIRRADDCVDIKLKRLENAEIFLDLPLYIGLFGTVSSFVVLTYSPTSGRLIAYSSTLVGIIFSVIMRTTLLYPTRSKLLSAKDETRA